MILDNDQILELIETPSNPNIKTWKDEHNVLDIFYNGGDVTSILEKVRNFENKEQKQLRDKIARSTKELLSYLLNPINKVFSATGFVTEMDFKSKGVEEEFSEYLEELPEGISLRKWMQVYWMEAYITDPNSVLFIESNEEESYPTYKSINVIHDYEYKWNGFEYIIFLAGKLQTSEGEYQIYRVYDGEKDGMYYVKNKELYVLTDDEGKEDIFYHELERIPAELASNIIDKKTGGRKSFINKIDETLHEYLRDSSVHSIYKFLHGFPIFWRYATKCTTCKGTGTVIDDDTAVPKTKKTCPTCNGRTIKITSDVSDGITLPLPKDGQQKLTPDIAGYVQPDLKTWEKQLDEMLSMKKDMYFAIWGTHLDEEKSHTATGRFIDAQPVYDALTTISTTAENIENRLVDSMATIMYGDVFQDIKIKYGKRFMVETPDVHWEKYIEAKEKNAPISTLDYLYKQFLMSEYHNDSAMMEQKFKEFMLEPFVHYSLEDLNGIATPEQMQRKILFSEWAVSGVDFNKDEQTLKQEFDEYVKSNIEQNAIT